MLTERLLLFSDEEIDVLLNALLNVKTENLHKTYREQLDNFVREVRNEHRDRQVRRSAGKPKRQPGESLADKIRKETP